jgi:hypothetical protein
MMTFLHGWRRKAGFATLATACVFMAGWIRSLAHEDSLILYRREPHASETITAELLRRELPVAETTSVMAKSIGQSVIFFRNTDWGSKSSGRRTFDWYSEPIPLGTTEECTSELEIADDGRWRFCGLDFGFTKGRITATYGWTSVAYKIPYGFFVIPLTLVSSFLLLSKPRVAKPNSDTEI